MNCSKMRNVLPESMRWLAGTGLMAASVLVVVSGVASASQRVAVEGSTPNFAQTLTDGSDPLTSTSVSFSISLPLHNRAELENLVAHQYDPTSSQYHHFLSTDEFVSRFSPSEQDYESVIRFAKQSGFTVEHTFANRTLLDVRATAGTVSRAFATNLRRWSADDGTVFIAPDSQPTLPSEIADKVGAVIGLNTQAHWHTHNTVVSPAMTAFLQPYQIGSGANGGLAPNDIKEAYGLSTVSETGSGQTIALFELDGYKSADISTYESAFGLPSASVAPVLIDSTSGAAGTNSGEVTLDIELALAVAPGASVRVYEAPNNDQGVVDAYTKIATDNIAKSVSTSWGLAENTNNTGLLNAESTAFIQMASQGQSAFAASGDNGSMDNGTTLSVDDPSSQPYMTGVGGTQLFVNSDRSFNHETTWNDGSASAGAGGGGESIIWTKPSYQTGLGSSATYRNVPDVSINADPSTGYAIALNGSWTLYGGTSCAAPIWAGFTALVNERRANNGSSPVGFVNPVIYQIGQGSRYTSDFHDVNDGSNNLTYVAVNGYDDATGWGSFNGANLMADLAPTSTPTPAPAPPAAPTGLTATVSGSTGISLAWTAVSGAISYDVLRSTTSGGTFTKISNVTAATFADSGLTAGTTYYYVVDARNANGASGNSNQASATVPMPPAPTSSTNFIAIDSAYVQDGGNANTAYGTGQALVVKNANSAGYDRVTYLKFDLRNVTTAPTTATLKLYLSAAYANGASGCTVSAYGVSDTSWSGTSLTWNTALVSDALTTARQSAGTYIGSVFVGTTVGTYSWDLTSYLQANIGKVVTIQLLDSTVDGVADVFTSTRSTTNEPTIVLGNSGTAPTPTPAPSAPSGLTAAANGTSAINLAWSASSGATSYTIGRSLTSGGPYTTVTSTSGTSFADSGLTAGTAYYYVASATNSAGSSANSSQATATTSLNLPGTPSGLTATANGTSAINLSWSATSGAASYTIGRSLTSGGPYSTVTTTSGTSFADSGLTAGTAYYYVASATNSAGSGANSSQATATTASAQVSTPTSPQTLFATDSTYVQGGASATTNYSGGSVLVVKNCNNTGYDRITYLKFDLTHVTSVPTSAQLNLTMLAAYTNGAAGCTVTAYGIPDTTWAGSTLNWNVALVSDNLSSAGTSTGTAISSAYVGQTPGVITWDITSYLQAHVGSVVTIQLADPTQEGVADTFAKPSASSGSPNITLSF